MGIFDKLFPKKKKCAICGEHLLSPDETKLVNGRGLAHLPPELMREAIILKLRNPYEVCTNCGATVCRGCAPTSSSTSHWRNYPNCPKCGSEMESV